jgi:hypothetical protein
MIKSINTPGVKAGGISLIEKLIEISTLETT